MIRMVMMVCLLIGLTPTMFLAPHTGVLLWTWLTVMSPHKMTWGFLADAPVNQVVAVITLGAWMVSREPKKLPMAGGTAILLLFIFWVTVTTLTALAPDMAWSRWDRDVKIMVLGLLVMILSHNRVRIHALIWITALSIGFYGVKGGLFSIATGGQYIVQGADGAQTSDRNHLALALCMTLPLLNYLRMQSARRIIRLGLIVAIGLCCIAVVGTYSRGGLIALSVVLGALLLKSRQKIVLLLAGLVMIGPFLVMMPSQWSERMNTIGGYNEDASFQGRVLAWRFAIAVALDRPLVGGGFSATEVNEVFTHYLPVPEAELEGVKAAHSIYFQVLGDHGFIGLGLYLLVLATLWRNARWVRRRAARLPDLRWAADLAGMVEISLLGFMVAGAALSMAYFDLPFILFGVMIACRRLVTQALRDARTEPGADSSWTTVGPSLRTAG